MAQFWNKQTHTPSKKTEKKLSVKYIFKYIYLCTQTKKYKNLCGTEHLSLPSPPSSQSHDVMVTVQDWLHHIFYEHPLGCNIILNPPPHPKPMRLYNTTLNIITLDSALIYSDTTQLNPILRLNTLPWHYGDWKIDAKNKDSYPHSLASIYELY